MTKNRKCPIERPINLSEEKKQRFIIKQKTRLHHQHRNWERKYRDYAAKIILNEE